MRVIDPLDLSGGMPNVYVNEYWSSNPNGLKTNPEPYKLWYTTQSNLCTFGDDLFYESTEKNLYDGGLDPPSATGTQQYFSGSEANDGSSGLGSATTYDNKFWTDYVTRNGDTPGQ